MQRASLVNVQEGLRQSMAILERAQSKVRRGLQIIGVGYAANYVIFKFMLSYYLNRYYMLY